MAKKLKVLISDKKRFRKRIKMLHVANKNAYNKKR